MGEFFYDELFAPIAVAATEIAIFVFLDEQSKVLGARHVPSSQLMSVDVPLRAIAADALAFDARAVVMAHNHPSGDHEPSEQDIRVTRRIARVLEPLGIRLVDHFVLSGGGVTSFRARGWL